MYFIPKTADQRIDELEAVLMEDEIECEVVHQFTPGLYSREVAFNAGLIVVGKVHRFEHQFCLLRGSLMVRDNDGNWVYLKAPFVGVTKPFTRRLAYVIEDAAWITFHHTDKTTPEEVEKEIIEPHINTVLGDELDAIRKFKKLTK